MPINHPARSIEIERGGIRRVLLAFDSLQDMLALEAASEVAALLRGSLQGLFIESSELLRLAQLPFIQEISLSPAMVRRMEILQLERDLRAQAERARRLIASQAQEKRIEWSFQVERGALATILASRSELDIVMLGRSQLSVPPSRQTVRGTTVLTLYDGSDSSRRALQTAARLASRDIPLLVAVPAVKPELRAEAAQLLASEGYQAHYLSLTETSPSQLITAGRHYHCRLMVVGGTIETVLPLLQHASCPVAWVR